MPQVHLATKTSGLEVTAMKLRVENQATGDGPFKDGPATPGQQAARRATLLACTPIVNIHVEMQIFSSTVNLSSFREGLKATPKLTLLSLSLFTL